MKKILLYTILFLQIGFSAEAVLSIDNFSENGSTVTFDIMMKNDEPVQGLQFTILSGEGEYDGTNACECSFECNNDGVCTGIIPAGCAECYYDNGLDFVANSYEEGYYVYAGSYDSVIYGSICDSPPTGSPTRGVCSDPSLTSAGDCEEEGKCINSNGVEINNSNTEVCVINGIIVSDFITQSTCENAGLDASGNICSDATVEGCTALGVWEEYSASDCLNSGVCSYALYTNEEDCLQDLGNDDAGYCDGSCTWTSSGNIWVPDNIWNSFSTPELCIEGGYDWNYSHRDPSGDDYRVLVDPNSSQANWNDITNFQFCRMPHSNDRQTGGYQTPGTTTSYAKFQGLFAPEEYSVAGHCSEIDSYCRDLSLSSCNPVICTEEDQNGNLVEVICGATGNCDNGFPSSGICNNSLSPDWEWTEPYRHYVDCTTNGFTWTPYDTQAVCEQYGGIWVGSEGGTQGNGFYDVGENFIDIDINIDITSVTNYPDGFFVTEGYNELLIFAFGGYVIPEATEPVRIATVTASVSGSASAGDKITLGARNICKDDYQLHCVSELIASDANGNRMDVSFTPMIWEIGGDAYSMGDIALNSDGECSIYAGETSETDSTCLSVCGDGYCDSTENYVNCKGDCPDTVSGDAYCNLYEGETFQNSADCAEFGCSDYVCASSEASESNGIYTISCSDDCVSYCGDQICDIGRGEAISNCSVDCDGSEAYGCTDQGNCNYNAFATIDDGSCALMGDLNEDDFLDILDIVQTINFVLGNIDITIDQQCLADINQDNFINILDIVLMANIILSQ